MKKTALLLSFCFALISFSMLTSCDEESIEEVLLNPELVGESIVRVQANDTLIIRKNIIGLVNQEGKFTFKVDLEGGDFLVINTEMFEKGAYPTNINVASYFYADLQDNGYSINIKQPEFLTGLIKIEAINKVAHVLDGSFKFKIYPPAENSLNLRPFTIEGDFENLKYARAEQEYFEAMLNGVKYKNNAQSARVVENTIEVKAVNSLTEEDLVLTFSKDIEVGTYGGQSFTGMYKSTAGVVYTTFEDLGPNVLRVKSNNGSKIDATFSMKLRSATGNVIEINQGEFKLTYN